MVRTLLYLLALRITTAKPFPRSIAMPYMTRYMVVYAKGENSDDNTIPPSVIKKIRELPSSVDPIEDEVEGNKPRSADVSPGGRHKSKSSATCKWDTGKPSSTNSKTPDKRVKKPKSGQGVKRTTSGQSLKRRKSSENKGKTGKVIPATVMALKPITVPGMDYDKLTFDEKQIKFIRELLRSNVKALKEMDASIPYEEAKKEFDMYSLGDKEPLCYKPHSAQAIYVCSHKHFPRELIIVCKLYEARGAYDPKKSLFLKTLRHLGKKHPNVIQTWDVIYKDSTIYAFQELAPYGNMVDYMAKNGLIKDESTAQEIGRQMRRGMDFLGDMGVSHRSICPRHVLVLHHDLRVKLTGFRSAIIYYDELKDDINYQPCLPLDKKNKEEDYNAPEVFGDPKTEHFDPICADTWSLGATIYKIVSGKFPYDCSKHNPKIETEIQSNVRNLKLSDNGKSAIGHLLTTLSTKRVCINKLRGHPWFYEPL